MNRKPDESPACGMRPWRCGRVAVLIVLFLLCFAAPGSSLGREPLIPAKGARSGGKTSLTMEEAVWMALRTHPLMGSHGADIEAARKKELQVKAAWWPQAGIEASYFFRGPLQKLTISQQVTTPLGDMDVNFEKTLGSYHNVNASVMAGWRAWDWGFRILMGKAASKGVEAARMARKDAAARLAYGVRTGFLALILYQELEGIAASGVAQAEAHLKDARLKAEGGTGHALNVAQAQVNLSKRQADLTRIRAMIVQIRTTLAVMCGLPAGSTWRGSGRLSLLAALPMPKSQEEMLDRIPAVRQANAAARSLELGARATLRTRWPTLDLTAGAAILYPKSFFEKEWGPAYQAGVTLRWQFWDGGLRKQQAEEARMQARKVKRLGQAARKQAAMQLAQANASVRTAEAELGSARSTLKAARTYLAAAQVAVKSGLNRMLELTDAQQAVLLAEAGIQKALFDKAMARAQVLWALGMAEEAPRKKSHHKVGR